MKFPHCTVHIRATVVRKSLDILTEYEDSFATGLLFSVGPGHPSNRLLYADQKAYYLVDILTYVQGIMGNKLCTKGYFSKHTVHRLL